MILAENPKQDTIIFGPWSLEPGASTLLKTAGQMRVFDAAS